MTPTCFVSWPSAPLTYSLVKKSLQALNTSLTITSIPPVEGNSFLIQWSTYDQIDHNLTYSHRQNVLSSSYIFRKALIRKHFLSGCIRSYVTKHSTSSLIRATPRTFEFELSFSDELDELWADDLWELGAEIVDSSSWWILKPGMADRGMGIRLFNSRDALQYIFDDFEDAEDDTEDTGTSVVTSQLRHFVVQEYIAKPLLLDPSDAVINGLIKPTTPEGHKFHLRAYCVASGALEVYLYTRILALFSAVPYVEPGFNLTSHDKHSPVDLAPHLTNTSLQGHHGENGVRLLEELIDCRILSGGLEDEAKLTTGDVNDFVCQIVDILAETFKAGLETPIHFQPLPNAFELYGVDFLISHAPASNAAVPLYQVKLLEINAEPAIELTGPRLTWILEDLFVSIATVCVKPFLEGKSIAEVDEGWDLGETRHNLIKCLEAKVRGSD